MCQLGPYFKTLNQQVSISGSFLHKATSSSSTLEGGPIWASSSGFLLQPCTRGLGTFPNLSGSLVKWGTDLAAVKIQHGNNSCKEPSTAQHRRNTTWMCTFRSQQKSNGKCLRSGPGIDLKKKKKNLFSPTNSPTELLFPPPNHVGFHIAEYIGPGIGFTGTRLTFFISLILLCF